MSEGLESAAAQLAVLAAKGTATTVANKFQAIRGKKNLEEVCNSYEELINELVAERAHAVALAQMYESELKRFQITDEDITHLQNTVSRVLDLLSTFAPGINVADLEKFKSLLSVDTLKAMQLIGFDYKAAIGDPLTRACAQAIECKLHVAGHGSSANKSKTRR